MGNFNDAIRLIEEARALEQLKPLKVDPAAESIQAMLILEERGRPDHDNDGPDDMDVSLADKRHELISKALNRR